MSDEQTTKGNFAEYSKSRADEERNLAELARKMGINVPGSDQPLPELNADGSYKDQKLEQPTD